MINHAKRKVLENMKVFVLDNSLRESTVGQVIGHSFEDKFKILDETAKCGFHHQIVGAFSTFRRVDDAFCKELKNESKGKRKYYAFSEVYKTIKGGRMESGDNNIPIGLKKMKKYGIENAIIEVDVANKSIEWDRSFSMSQFMDHLTCLLKWTNDNLPSSSNKRMNFINLRDFPVAMITCPDRVLDIVKNIANLPLVYRPVGLLHEEPLGEYFADEVAAWNKSVRETMDKNGWPSLFQKTGDYDGLLLTHVHKQWGLADGVVLDVLASGADGIWSSVAEEGAAMGHACSCVTLANLARLGNKDVLKRYETKYLAKAAKAVTKLTTKKEVANRQIVYGPRAIEAVFGFSGIAGGTHDPTFDANGDGKIDGLDHFSLAEFLGAGEPPIRITTLSSPKLVVERLNQCFGDNPEFTEEMGQKMLNFMEQELIDNQVCEHTSPMGIAVLWQNITGTLLPEMDEIVQKVKAKKGTHVRILEEAKDCFFNFVETGENSMDFLAFYEAYLKPYFGCFSCPRTRFVLGAIDLDGDNNVTWEEWRFWCLWALHQYSDEIIGIEDLNHVVLRNAILPLGLSKTSNPPKKLDDILSRRMLLESSKAQNLFHIN